MKKLLVTLALAVGIIGATVGAATPASAIPVRGSLLIDGDTDGDPALLTCVRANVTIFGNRIGTGSEVICVL